MKKTDQLVFGNEPRWGLQPRAASFKPESHGFERGFISLAEGVGAASERTLMRTYGPGAEKFAHSVYSEPPSGIIGIQHRISGPPNRNAGQTWGVGSETFYGTRKVPGPVSSDEVAPTGLRRLEPKPSDEYKVGDSMGKKLQVFDAAGRDMRRLRSDEFSLESRLQRKQQVSEEARTEHRTIDRAMPPGLKGFLGAEYSNDYWKLDGVVVRMRMKPSKDDLMEQALRTASERGTKLGKTKTFAEKRIDEDLIEQRQLVNTLNLDYDYITDDEDRPAEPAAEAPS